MKKKIHSVEVNNRRKILTVGYGKGHFISLHFSQFSVVDEEIVRAWVDRETHGLSVGLEFEGGRVDFMPYDQPLALSRDPEFLLQNQIERLIADIKMRLEKKKMSKRFLAKALETSDNQVQRLLNPKILNKNLEQLYRIASILGVELELSLKEAA